MAWHSRCPASRNHNGEVLEFGLIRNPLVKEVGRGTNWRGRQLVSSRCVPYDPARCRRILVKNEFRASGKIKFGHYRYKERIGSLAKLNAARASGQSEQTTISVSYFVNS